MNDIMNDDSLRADLGAEDGVKLIGRCTNITALRAIEPDTDQQLIEVISHSNNDTKKPYQIQSGGRFQSDLTDKTTIDDNWLCIVTTKGNRWKRIIENSSLNLSYAGVQAGDDITTPLKNAISYLKKVFISENAPAYLPVITINSGNYIISDKIEKPPFIKILGIGSVDIDASAIVSGPVFDIFNDISIPKPIFSGPGMNCDDISCVGGTLTITGGAKISGGATAFAYGNKNEGLAPCRGVGFRNVIARNFGVGLTIRANDTYLLTFSDSRLEQNSINFSINSATNNNSGEAIVLSNIVFGGSGSDHIHINSPGIELIFDKCKADYANRHVINIGSQCDYSSLKFTNFRCEEFRGYFLSGTPSTLGNVNVFFNNLTILGRTNGDKENGNSISRPLFNHDQGINISINGLETFVEMRPYTEKINISEKQNSSLKISHYIPRSYRYLTNDSYILNRGSNFSDEISGSAINSTSNELIRFSINSISDVSGNIIDLDNSKAIQLTGTSRNGYISFQSELVTCLAGDLVAASCALQALSATGTINMDVTILWYDKDLNFISLSSVSTYNFTDAYNDITLPNYNLGTTRKLSSPSYTKTAPTGTNYARVRWIVSGFIGTLNIINMLVFKTL